MSAFDALRGVVETLRSPDGCAWDRAQSPDTLAEDLLEEAAEVVDAIRAGPPGAVRDELGDLLFLVLLIARCHEEAGTFSVDDVARAARDKMIRRHPHVFGDADEAPDWERLKAAERGERPRSLLDGVPRALGPLMTAHEAATRAARVGFDWPDREGVRAKVDEELAELDEALAEGDLDHAHAELGDLLLTLVNLGRFLPGSAHAALGHANRKFARRFREVERLTLDAGEMVATSSMDELEARWRAAKERVG